MAEDSSFTIHDNEQITFLYFEKQVDYLCAIHMMNNSLQGPRFSRELMAQISTQLEEQSGHQHHDASGNYSDDAIKMALQTVDAQLIPITEEFIKCKLVEDGFL